MVVALKAWKLQAWRNDLDLVFTQLDGTPIRRSAMVKNGFWPALKGAGLRHVKFHSLRHSYTSGLIGHGAPITEVALLLGHEDPSLTL